MRLFVLIVLLIVFPPITSLAQLRGKYVMEAGFRNETYFFKKNGTFRYAESDCLGGRYGNGIYQIIGSKLIFSYANTKIQATPVVIKKCKDLADTLKMHFRLLDDKKRPVVNAGIKLNVGSQFFGGNVSDFDGEAWNTVSVQSDTIDVTILTKNNKLWFRLPPTGQFDVTLTITSNKQIPNGTRNEFEIVVKKDRLLIKDSLRKDYIAFQHIERFPSLPRY